MLQAKFGDDPFGTFAYLEHESSISIFHFDKNIFLLVRNPKMEGLITAITFIEKWIKFF